VKKADAVDALFRRFDKALRERTRIANAQKSKVRSAVEHVFAHQKGLMGLIVRTICLQ
jgi:IS5 family transposase